MLELTPKRARHLARTTLNSDTQQKMFAWLRANAETKARARLGIVTRPADYGHHQHEMHQWVLGYVQCAGCGLRLPKQAVA